MRRSGRGSIAVVLVAVVVAGVFSPSSNGITWCFDWVAYQFNGKKDTNRNSAATLRDLLRTRGFTPVLEVRAKTGSGDPAAPRPQDIELAIARIAPPEQELDEKLKPGDVLIFKDFHTGIIRTRDGSFDHFLQVPGKSGTRYTPQEAAQSENYFVGPGKRWTLQQFFAFSREQPPKHSNDLEWATWREWLGRLVFGAPKQYPFLHSTAEVWRRTTLPSGAPLWAGQWTTSTGGVAFRLLDADDITIAKTERRHDVLFDMLPCKESGPQFYRGGYTNPNGDAGKVIACGTATSLSGRWSSNVQPGNNGSFRISISSKNPLKFSGSATPDGGSPFTWTGTWTTQISGDD